MTSAKKHVNIVRLTNLILKGMRVIKGFCSDLANRLSDIHRNITRLETAILKKSKINLTYGELQLIELLSRFNNGITVSEVANYMGVTRPTATVAVSKLETKGYVVKESVKDDARKFIVNLTHDGKRTAHLHKRCQRQLVHGFDKELSEEERAVLIKAVDKLNTYFDTIE